MKRADRLVAVTVGHVPREISRAVWFFLEREGSLTGKVAEEKYRPTPIAKGIEIILSAQLKLCDEKRKYLERMKEIVQMNYVKADVDSFEIGAMIFRILTHVSMQKFETRT